MLIVSFLRFSLVFISSASLVSSFSFSEKLSVREKDLKVQFVRFWNLYLQNMAEIVKLSPEIVFLWLQTKTHNAELPHFCSCFLHVCLFCSHHCFSSMLEVWLADGGGGVYKKGREAHLGLVFLHWQTHLGEQPCGRPLSVDLVGTVVKVFESMILM